MGSRLLRWAAGCWAGQQAAGSARLALKDSCLRCGQGPLSAHTAWRCAACLPPCLPRSYGVARYRLGNDFGYFKVKNRVAFRNLEEQVGPHGAAARGAVCWCGGDDWRWLAPCGCGASSWWVLQAAASVLRCLPSACPPAGPGPGSRVQRAGGAFPRRPHLQVRRGAGMLGRCSARCRCRLCGCSAPPPAPPHPPSGPTRPIAQTQHCPQNNRPTNQKPPSHCRRVLNEDPDEQVGALASVCLAAADLGASVAFYADCLGMLEVDRGDDFAVLAAGGGVRGIHGGEGRGWWGAGGRWVVACTVEGRSGGGGGGSMGAVLLLAMGVRARTADHWWAPKEAALESPGPSPRPLQARTRRRCG